MQDLFTTGIGLLQSVSWWQKAIDETTKRVNGEVKLVLYKGNVIVIGRKSPNSLYDEDLATFESSNYDQRDAEGFIKLNALRLKKISLNSRTNISFS